MIAKRIVHRPHYRQTRSPYSGHSSRSKFGRKTPLVNILENENEYVIEMAIPGINKEDLSIEVKDKNLHISNIEKENVEKKEGKTLFQEYDYTQFEKIFSLSKDIDVEKLNAEYTNGILEITLPKKEEVSLKINIH